MKNSNRTILIAGGTGTIGKYLTETFLKFNYQVRILSRSKQGEEKGVSYFKWNPDKGEFPTDSLNGVHAVINLTGRGVDDKRWSYEFKQELYNSRINSTELLVKNVNEHSKEIDTFVNASAIGYYGFNRGEEELDEHSDPSDDYFGNLCYDWEKAVQIDAHKNIRTVIIRIGVVLMPNEGAYHKLKQPILLSLGSALGTGKQYMSWIHIEDLVQIFLAAVVNPEMKGVYNAVAPNPVRNKFLVGKIADSLNKVLLLPNVPSFALKLVLGEMSKAVLGSLKIKPKRLLEQNFAFRYDNIEGAVRKLNWNK